MLLWVKAEPKALGCGVNAKRPLRSTRRLSRSIPCRQCLSCAKASGWLSRARRREYVSLKGKSSIGHRGNMGVPIAECKGTGRLLVVMYPRRIKMTDSHCLLFLNFARIGKQRSHRAVTWSRLVLWCMAFTTRLITCGL